MPSFCLFLVLILYNSYVVVVSTNNSYLVINNNNILTYIMYYHIFIILVTTTINLMLVNTIEGGSVTGDYNIMVIIYNRCLHYVLPNTYILLTTITISSRLVTTTKR